MLGQELSLRAGSTWAGASRVCSVTSDVPSAQPRARRVSRRRAGLSWLQVTPASQTGPVSGQESPAICSAKGCQAAATWAVVWNNPRLHAPDREKVWVACGEHKQPLADYLAVRSFLKRVEPLAP